MIKAILSGLLSMLTSIVNIFLLPINVLFENLFPDMTNSISVFNQFVNNYLGGSLSYFFSIFPPIFRNTLIIWLAFVVGYYTIHFTYTSAIKVWTIIQKIKFW